MPDTLSLAADALKSAYGLAGAIRLLPGELDLNFELSTRDRRYVFKIMRAGCDPRFVDMQIAATDRVRNAGLGRLVSETIRSRGGDARISLVDEEGVERVAWLNSFLPGQLMARATPWTPQLASSIGETMARICVALDGFEHPLLDRRSKWDLRQGGWIAGRLDALEAGTRRRMVARVAADFAKKISPQLETLPRSPIHGDANDMNILVKTSASGESRVSGVIDFGDMIKTPRVCEPAIAMAYAMMGDGDPFARGAALAAAFDATAPLSDAEKALLPALVKLRLAITVTNAAAARRAHPDNAYLTVSEAPAWRLLEILAALDDDLLAARLLGAGDAPAARAGAAGREDLLARRRRVAPGNMRLSYERPLHFTRGERHFLYDADGADYLDAYNNVPHVGHANPVVVDAVARQMAALNTNTRYLQEVHVDYAERMLALLPQTLSKIIFLNSASEANELALRLARAATGARDMIVMDHGYHGATTGAMDISPYKFSHPRGAGAPPDWVHVAPQPNLYGGPYRGADAAQRYVADVEKILAALAQNRRPLAGFISECVPSVGGQVVLPDGYLAAVYARVRAAGGVCIADDVQTALGRLGDVFWGFEPQRVAPDMVVLGKPLGNGFPLAAVAMTEEIAAAFASGPEFFSTFGGSSAACAAGRAALDVLFTDDLQANARKVGASLIAGLRALAGRHEIIGDVRGSGFFLGVDLVADRKTRAPATGPANFVKNRLREKRVLIGVEGPGDNVLKIRPPMTFDAAAADRLLAALDEVLRETRA